MKFTTFTFILALAGAALVTAAEDIHKPSTRNDILYIPISTPVATKTTLNRRDESQITSTSNQNIERNQNEIGPLGLDDEFHSWSHDGNKSGRRHRKSHSGKRSRPSDWSSRHPNGGHKKSKGGNNDSIENMDDNEELGEGLNE
ncbi:hypothetical protein BX661DRAFT_191473 [Kickxella alabastrina]|uniref:uncharacterized protein n=1 Tax=Kickxella alabastrina TaxID=61397 RepID=UPI00221E5E9B|nr:uncharacterized protein BX661DRAFT_191473 [Kickxella alabastrina]KAI7818612.1 hypothetical protein BX661DRAFT_191473 [Kickxella alabastrina]KAJ1946695.1 hypothetical protein GGF37_001015 [Kickxella alabastrina]